MIIFIIIAGLILVSFALMMSKNSKQPSNLGITAGKLAPLPSKPNCISTQTDNSDKRVSPLPFKDTLVKSREEIIDIIKSFKKTEIIEMSDDYIYAVFITDTLKFRDDVEFYFDINNKKIHFRSASRVGYSDMGMNKKRYEEIKNKYLSN